MKKFGLLFTCLLFVALTLSGCGPSETQRLATVESLVQVAVLETVAAMPTQTPLPTQTAWPTYTPLPTFTPLPTQTPLPTLTALPLATDTPTPTETPVETATATSLPTSTPGTTTAVQPPPAANVTDQVLAALTSLIHDADTYRYAIFRFNPNPYQSNRMLPSDCPLVIATHNHLANIVTINTSSATPEVQNGYAYYRSASTEILNMISPWTEACRQAVAAGEEKEIIDQNNFSIISHAMDVYVSQLNQLVNTINQSGN